MQVMPKLKKSLVVSCWIVTLPFRSRPFIGQSTQKTPTSVAASDIVSSIAARDLGDSRMTQHFYHFAGMPGDVLITVKSNNLNGDVDVFTAGTLRPLLKFTLYAESSSAATKGIYLRRREELILRVEAAVRTMMKELSNSVGGSLSHCRAIDAGCGKEESATNR